MQKKYGPKALAAISVSLDEASDTKARANVMKFLTEQGARFTNLLLDEKPEFWQEKLHFDGPPCVFVFNADGEVEKQFKDEFTYADVEKVVKALVGKK